jgi:predicted phosphodiesterase
VSNISQEYLQKPEEAFIDYCDRLIMGKKSGLYDLDKSEIWKLLFNEDMSSDESRKQLRGIEKAINKLKQECLKELPKSQLDDIREKVGELDILKQQIKNEKNELGKLKREFVKSISIAEELKYYLAEHNTIIIPEYCSDSINEDSEYEMIIHITDFHIGYIIDDCKGNYFNWKIANERIDKLIQQCYRYIEFYNIKKVYVINTGDVIEHNSMRKNQSQFCEFTQSVQINKAIELIYRFLTALCKYCDVEYDSIYGNHDRMNGDKTANLDGDNAEVIIREQLSKYKELSNNNRLKVINRKHTDKEIRKMIRGLNCKFVHGEDSKVDGKQEIKNQMSMDNEFYDILFKGHLHNFKIESENNGRYIVSTGCLSGYNDFSVNFGCSTIASQTITVVTDNKVELIKDVQLQ